MIEATNADYVMQLGIIKLGVQFLNAVVDAMTLYPQTYSSNMVASAAKLFALLRDALLSHRWSEVTEVRQQQTSLRVHCIAGMVIGDV